MTARLVDVIDIDKTSAQFAVVDLETRTQLDERRQVNSADGSAPYPHHDVEGLWQFLCDGITELNRRHPLDALVATTHGATAALVDAEGRLALPVLDYDYPGPDAMAREYDRVRPDFTESFTPRLRAGLNLGAQLFWLSRAYPTEWARTRWILPYPQYWAYRLTGVPCSEVSSLGCHTDLWNFETDLYSSLVLRQGWIERMPEVRPASDVLGTVEPALAARLGLRPNTPVHVGLHRPNGALLPHLVDREPPFSVIYSGLWTVVFSPGGDLAALDPERDCLANIDVFGKHVPSARFMGGREYQQLICDTPPSHVSEAAVSRVLDGAIMLMPSVVPTAGPFPGRKSYWNRPIALIDSEAHYVAVSFYLAMMTAECLTLTGADGPVFVEGPFAENRLYVEMLASACGRPVSAVHSEFSTATLGAALLANLRNEGDGEPVAAPAQPSARLAAYAEKWRQAVAG